MAFPQTAETVIVCALMDEARPFLKEWELAPVRDFPSYPLFQREDRFLLVTGMGKTRAAAATSAFLQYRVHDREQTHPETFPGYDARLPSLLLLNIGIAGARDPAQTPLGTPCPIHRIEDQGTGECWYPDMLFRYPPLREASLRTLDQPALEGPEQIPEGTDLVDMEAAGILTAARPYLQNHQVLIWKIPSDPLRKMENFRASVTEWMHGMARQWDSMLPELLEKLAEPPILTADEFQWTRKIARILQLTFSQEQQWHKACLARRIAGRPLPQCEPPAPRHKKERQQLFYDLLQRIQSPRR